MPLALHELLFAQEGTLVGAKPDTLHLHLAIENWGSTVLTIAMMAWRGTQTILLS